MTRAEKIRKFVNAAKDFRGCKCGKKFIRAPQPNAAPRVVKWLAALGYDVEDIKAHMVVLSALKTYDEFYAFVKGLEVAA